MTASARTARLVAMAIVALAALAGCAPDDPEPSPSAPTPSDAPEEQTDEELLAEAREVYEGYLAASTAMWSEPGADYTQLSEWANSEVASEEAAAHTALRDSGVVSIGPMSLTAFIADGRPEQSEVQALVCVDFREARHLDATGIDVTPSGSVDFAALVVRFARGSERLLIVAQDGLPEGATSPCG